MKAPNNQAGFTLVEMLVSLAVIGMAAGLLALGIGRMGLDLTQSARADTQLDQISAAQFLLRHRIARAFPAKDRQTGNSVEFDGEAKSLDFLGTAPDAQGPQELQHYRLKLAQDGTLTLYQISSLTTAVDPHQRATVGWQATPLLRGVADLSLAYFGPRPNGTGNSWQPDWSRRPTLPMLVRLRVDLAENALARGAHGWPDLVIHPSAATGDICERDMKTDQCKGAL
jgi:prepilin-type N-terminal cleavage/methylation domain-containing protein